MISMHNHRIQKAFILALVFFLSFIWTGCAIITRELVTKDDSVVEEFIEDQLEEELGWDVDLTPGSPEN